MTGERVEPMDYQWEMSLSNGPGVWIRQSDVANQIALNVDGWNSNQLKLDYLRKPIDLDRTEVVYEVRCTALYNHTFNTSSHPFLINIRGNFLLFLFLF